MSSVRKRELHPSGAIRWQVDYRDRQGKRHHKQFSTKAEAISFETKVRGEIAAGTHVSDSASVTIRVAGEIWLERGELDELEAGTLRQRRQHLKHHINPLIGNLKLSRLASSDVEAFRDELLIERSRPLARAVLTSLKSILKEARRRGLMAHDPAAQTNITISKRGERTKIEIPTKDEIRSLLAKSAELWPVLTRIERTRTGENKSVGVCWRPLIVTALFTGLRCSEIRGLTWEHVDFDKRMIRVRQRADFQNTMGPPKSSAGNRDVPMAPMVFNTLREWKLACPATASGIAFPSENGRIHSNSNIHKQCWGPLQRAAGLIERYESDETREQEYRPRYTFHALRHAAASLFIEQRWTPKKIQTVMGHSSIQVTFDTYGHLWDDAEGDQKAMAELEMRLLRPIV